MPKRKRIERSEGAGGGLGRVYRWFWPVAGVASLVWFLIRVIPKPSRATYPCQRAAMPLASGFVIWLIGIVGSAGAMGKARRLFRGSRYFVAGSCVCAAVLCLWWPMSMTRSLISQGAFVPTDPSNTPMGEAKGIWPGRVVWVHDPDATSWNGSTGNWWDDANTDPARAAAMFSRAIRSMTGEKFDVEAWEALFVHFNEAHGLGSVGYQAGEKVSVKLNMAQDQNSGWDNNDAVPSPQMVYALVEQLINVAGVAGEDIVLYDSSRYIGDPIVNKIRSNPSADFQAVTYVVSPYYAPSVSWPRVHPVADTTAAVVFSEPDIQTYSGATYLPTCVTGAKYLINYGLFRGHSLAGITLTGKNLFGTLYRPMWASTWHGGWTPGGGDAMMGLHGYVNVVDVDWDYYLTARPMGTYNALVDLMGHEQLGGKTLFYMVDGLYASRTQSKSVSKFVSFGNDWTSSLFMSMDQAAIDSVGLDFLRNESTCDPYVTGAVDNYLHEAAYRDPVTGLAPSGMLYDPEDDDDPLPSLGVHEHWNNATDKQYTRNLGTGDGIELVQPLTGELEKADLNMDGKIDHLDFAIFYDEWMSTNILKGDIQPDGGDGDVDLMDFAVLAAGDPAKADLDNSGEVDIEDYALFSEDWLGKAVLLKADIEPEGGDGDVDLGDYAVLVRCFQLYNE